MRPFDQILRERIRYVRRYRDPRRAIRRAYAEVDRLLCRHVPRHFAHEGTVRRWVLSATWEEFSAHLADRVVYTLDTALVLDGLRPWGPGRDIWLYVSEWPALLEAEQRGLLRPVSAAASPSDVVVHACLPGRLPEAVRTGDGRRRVNRQRLVEDLLGTYGLRHDLFARLDPELAAAEPGGNLL